MASNRWREVEAVLDAALAAGPEQWQAILDRHCGGDRELRQEVEALLSQVGQVDGFLSAVPGSVAAAFIAETRKPMPEEVAGRYTLHRELHRGPMGTVYHATDRSLDRPVAVKILETDLAAVVGVSRFLREIEITRRLTHPHILPLLDSGGFDQSLYYVVPFVPGGSLLERLRRQQALPVGEALELGRQVAGALGEAHRHGVVHRDIKPSNVLLEGSCALVADFGIAKAIGTADAAALTRTGVTLGTPPYMSPEQAAGVRELDARSDIYSLACLVFEMLAGRPPFTGRSMQVCRQHLTLEAPSVTTFRPETPAAVAAALARALAKAPADRHADVGAFAGALSD